MSWWYRLVYAVTIAPRVARLQRLLPDASIHPCGSRAVCDPPVFGTDVDFLIYSEALIVEKLTKAKYEMVSLSVDYFQSPEKDWEKRTVWRKGVINLIVTQSEKFRDRWNISTHICRKYNLRQKSHRILVYETLRGNFNPEYWQPEYLPPPEVLNLLKNINGPYGEAIYAAYRTQNNL